MTTIDNSGRVFEAQPPERIATILREQKRQSPVYAHLLEARGLGVAEKWINALAWMAPCTAEESLGYFALAQISETQGWLLHASAESERIAKSTREA